MAKLWPWEVRAPKWHLAYFVPIDGHFGQVFEIWTSNLLCLVFTLTLIYKVNQTQIGYSIPKKLQKLTKVAISQNHILPKCHSPKSLLLLHFSMNLSETFRIDVNMDFAHTNFGRFFSKLKIKIWEKKHQKSKSSYNQSTKSAYSKSKLPKYIGWYPS